MNGVLMPPVLPPLRDLGKMPLTGPTDTVLEKLSWMRADSTWPNGLRYLWTNALSGAVGVPLLPNGGHPVPGPGRIDRFRSRPGAEMGRHPHRRGARSGRPVRPLSRQVAVRAGLLGRVKPECRQGAVGLVRQIHDPFVIRSTGVIWKMKEELTGSLPASLASALSMRSTAT